MRVPVLIAIALLLPSLVSAACTDADLDGYNASGVGCGPADCADTPGSYCTGTEFVYSPPGISQAKDLTIYFHNGLWHLFYINRTGTGWYNSGSEENLGHATSLNLINWTNHESVMPISNNGWDDRNVWAPYIIKHEGKYYMFYTGVSNYTKGDINDALVNRTERIGIATSTNLFDWERLPINNCEGSTGDGCVFDCNVPGTSVYTSTFHACRDPMIYAENGTYYLLTSTRNESGAQNGSIILMSNSTDLINWQSMGTINTTQGDKAESSFVVKQGNKYYLAWTQDTQGIPEVWQATNNELNTNFTYTGKIDLLWGFAADLFYKNDTLMSAYISNTWDYEIAFSNLSTNSTHLIASNYTTPACYLQNNTIHPFATELYDGADNDCDGMIDETQYQDNNLNGYKELFIGMKWLKSPFSGASPYLSGVQQLFRTGFNLLLQTESPESSAEDETPTIPGNNCGSLINESRDNYLAIAGGSLVYNTLGQNNLTQITNIQNCTSTDFSTFAFWTNENPIYGKDNNSTAYPNLNNISEAYNNVTQTSLPTITKYSLKDVYTNASRWQSNITKYLNYTDIVALDLTLSSANGSTDCSSNGYCILQNNNLSAAGEAIDILQNITSKPIISVLPYTANYTAKKYLTYDSIIHGASGIIFDTWNQDLGVDNETIWNETKNISAELNYLSHALSNGCVDINASNDVDTAAFTGRDNNNQTMLYIIASSETEKQDVSISTQCSVYKNTVLWENRTLQGNNFEDNFTKQSIHVYELWINPESCTLTPDTCPVSRARLPTPQYSFTKQNQLYANDSTQNISVNYSLTLYNDGQQRISVPKAQNYALYNSTNSMLFDTDNKTLNTTFNSSQQYDLLAIISINIEDNSSYNNQTYRKNYTISSNTHLTNITINISANTSYSYNRLFWYNGTNYTLAGEKYNFFVGNNRVEWNNVSLSTQQFYINGSNSCVSNLAYDSWSNPSENCGSRSYTDLNECVSEGVQTQECPDEESSSSGSSSSSSSRNQGLGYDGAGPNITMPTNITNQTMNTTITNNSNYTKPQNETQEIKEVQKEQKPENIVKNNSSEHLPIEFAILSGIILAVMMIALMLWVGRHEIPPDHEAQKFIHKAYQQGLSPEQIIEHFQKKGWHIKRAHKQLHHYHKHYHKKFKNGNTD